MVTFKGSLTQTNARDDGQQHPDVASLRPANPVEFENWATSGGLLHLDDNMMDFADAAGNVHSLDRSVLWDTSDCTPPNITVRIFSGPDGLGPDGESIRKVIYTGVGMSDDTGFSVRFYGGLEQPTNEYAKLYGETLEKYNGGEIDSDEFDRRVGIMDQHFDKAAQSEQRVLSSIISRFSRAMRVNDSEFFNARTDPDVEAFLSDVGRMYDNIRNHIKSGGDVAGLTKEIIEAGCTASGLNDVKFLHSDKFYCDYFAPAMRAYMRDGALMSAKIGAKWVEEHAKTWVNLNTGADATAISGHLKSLLLKLVNYGNDYRPGSFLQQLSYGIRAVDVSDANPDRI
jgi:hypothetical protein